MDEAGIDVLVSTAKHTVQYLLGGYRYIMFHSMDAIAHSRYLPLVIYPKGQSRACCLHRQCHGGARAGSRAVLDAPGQPQVLGQH